MEKFHENQDTSSFLLAKNTKKPQQILPKQKINKQNPKPTKKSKNHTSKTPNQPTNQLKMKKVSNKHLETNKKNLTQSSTQMYIQLDAVV